MFVQGITERARWMTRRLMDISFNVGYSAKVGDDVGKGRLDFTEARHIPSRASFSGRCASMQAVRACKRDKGNAGRKQACKDQCRASLLFL